MLRRSHRSVRCVADTSCLVAIPAMCVRGQDQRVCNTFHKSCAEPKKAKTFQMHGQENPEHSDFCQSKASRFGCHTQTLKGTLRVLVRAGSTGSGCVCFCDGGLCRISQVSLTSYSAPSEPEHGEVRVTSNPCNVSGKLWMCSRFCVCVCVCAHGLSKFTAILWASASRCSPDSASVFV